MVQDAPAQPEKLQPEDYRAAAEYIWEEWTRRKSERHDLDAAWDEIERQVKMKYDAPLIDRESGRARRGTGWMPQLELPWQRETLELLTTDMDRMTFPAVGNHFDVEASATDKTLEIIEVNIERNQGAIGAANQELVNEIVTAVHNTYQNLYGYRGQWRRMFADAFMYGTMAGTVRPIDGRFLQWDGMGHRRDLVIPALTHRPMRNVWLDTSQFSAQRLGNMQAPGQIYEYTQRLPDLKMAAQAQALGGGWLPAEISDIASGSYGRDNQDVQVLEYEGDLVFSRDGQGDVYIPHVIVTTILGYTTSRATGSHRIIRVQYPDLPFTSYLYQPYFVDSEHNGIYGTSPLMMGRPIQKAGSVAMNRWLASIILNAEPPVQYDPSDPHLAQAGGPVIEPRAQWPSLAEVKPVIIGDPQALGAGLMQLRSEYQDVTGTMAPRLGQQTKSHQTAFAVDTEMVRGLSRTVSFGQWVTSELMPRQLQMEYYLLKKYMPKSGLLVMLPKTKVWLTVTPGMLPDYVQYEVAGAADPQLEAQKSQRRLVALQQIGAIEQIKVQIDPQAQRIDWVQMQREILTEGGFTDVDRILQQPQEPALDAGLLPPAEEDAGVAAGQPGVPSAGGGLSPEDVIRLAAGQGRPMPG